MSRIVRLTGLAVWIPLAMAACANDDDDAPECDDTRRPIVFAHGMLASGDTYANHSMRFASNGYCLDRIYAYDWNTLGGDGDRDERFDAFVDRVLAETRAETIDLGGHSMGGALGSGYLSDPERAAKVSHYAHIGSGPLAEGPPGGVPTLNVWSPGDLVASNEGIAPGATDGEVDGQDHYQVATTVESFEAIYTHFNDGVGPDTLSIVPQTPIFISGRAVTLGENVPSSNASVSIYETVPETGERAHSDPEATFTTDSEGYWGPFQARPGAYYELMVAPTSGYIVHYYREPFVRSNDLVYLRTLPEPEGSLVGGMLSAIPIHDEVMGLIVFTANQAVIHGRDQLVVNGLEVTSEAIAPAEKTLIASFFFDADDDEQTSGQPAGAFGFIPFFLAGLDMYIPAEPRRSVPLAFNGRTLNVPTLKSESEGIVVAVFD